MPFSSGYTLWPQSCCLMSRSFWAASGPQNSRHCGTAALRLSAKFRGSLGPSFSFVMSLTKTSWMEAMSARLVDDDKGRITISLATPGGAQSLATITTYFGILGGLFRNMWDRDEMAALLESDDNFEIVASTAKSIYDRTCRSCDLENRLIILQHKDGKVQWAMRIDHRAGDTDAKKNYLNQQKRLAEKSAAPADKRHRDGQEWREPQWQQSGWWHNYRNQGSNSEDRQDQ